MLRNSLLENKERRTNILNWKSAEHFIGQHISTKFFVLCDAFLDAPLSTVRAFLKMIRECIAILARSLSASATTGPIWCLDYHNLHKGYQQFVARHTGREASLSLHTCVPCSLGKHCLNSCTVGHSVVLPFTTSFLHFAL